MPKQQKTYTREGRSQGSKSGAFPRGNAPPPGYLRLQLGKMFADQFKLFEELLLLEHETT